MTKKQYSDTQRDELLAALHNGVVTVSFTKVNGERRDMQCTLNKDYLPVVESTRNSNTTRRQNPDTQSVYDINAKGWRSWRWENVIEYEYEDENE